MISRNPFKYNYHQIYLKNLGVFGHFLWNYTRLEDPSNHDQNEADDHLTQVETKDWFLVHHWSMSFLSYALRCTAPAGEIPSPARSPRIPDPAFFNSRETGEAKCWRSCNPATTALKHREVWSQRNMAMRIPMERMERWESPLGSELTLLWSASCQLDCFAWLLLCWKWIAISLDGSDGHWIRPNWDPQNKQDKQTQCKLCQCEANVRAYYQNRYFNCLKLGPIPATRKFGNTSCISEAKLMFPVSTSLDDLHLEVLEVEQLPKKVQSSALKSPHSRWMQMRENAIFTCSLCRA